MLDITLSPLELERFGVITAKARNINADNLVDIDDFCTAHGVQMVIGRIDTRELLLVQQMEDAGYRLMDTLVYYVRDLERNPIEPVTPPVTFRPVTPADGEAIADIARISFEGYFGHYHADPRLPDEASDAVYVDWAVRSISDRNLAGDMIVAEVDGQVVGFVTSRVNGDDGEVVLSGVHPSARRQGIYQAFLEHGTHWCQTQGAKKVWFITQIINVAVQKVYVRLGYTLHHSEYTLHKWTE